jgi:hypothetical protein
MGRGAIAPDGYHKISAHLIFDVKHDLRHKARMVAGGHLTKLSKERTYSGVVSLRTLQLIVFVAELNGLDLWAADVGNAYLEAYTKEKVYIVAGPEFEKLEGHTLLFEKALYGLRSSGARWHDRLADALRDIGFLPCYAEPDLWIRHQGTHYEYIGVYVDDLAIASNNCIDLLKTLKEKFDFKFKGVVPMKYYLGSDIGRDPDGTLFWSAKTYIGRMLSNYEHVFGEKPKPSAVPADKGDHPEIDMSEELDHNGMKLYQSLIGALQWVVSLCQFDIAVAVITLSHFRIAPHVGHMIRVKKIIGYLRCHPDGGIRFRIDMPTLPPEYKPETSYSWEYSIYGKLVEELPSNMPDPLGKMVSTTTFCDANLYHDVVTGRSMTGILHMVNQTPIDWFSK